MSNVQATRTNMPVVLLKDGASETKGREAQRNNIAAARIISDIVNTSLGPKGMDKMLVDSLGDVTITNDGATILKEIDVQHPAAKMLVEIAKTTDNEVGDGTTSAVVLAGALLNNAESLIIIFFLASMSVLESRINFSTSRRLFYRYLDCLILFQALCAKVMLQVLMR